MNRALAGLTRRGRYFLAVGTMLAFIAILGGTGNVLAPFLSAAIFEALRTLASQYAPNVWQMSLGIAMLAIIMFLPGGLSDFVDHVVPLSEAWRSGADSWPDERRERFANTLDVLLAVVDAFRRRFISP
jgi:hypothetical protein